MDAFERAGITDQEFKQALLDYHSALLRAGADVDVTLVIAWATYPEKTAMDLQQLAREMDERTKRRQNPPPLAYHPDFGPEPPRRT